MNRLEEIKTRVEAADYGCPCATPGCTRCDARYRHLSQCAEDVPWLLEQLRVAREALEFYASEHSWHPGIELWKFNLPSDSENPRLVAKQALAKMEK